MIKSLVNSVTSSNFAKNFGIQGIIFLKLYIFIYNYEKEYCSR